MNLYLRKERDFRPLDMIYSWLLTGGNKYDVTRVIPSEGQIHKWFCTIELWLLFRISWPRSWLRSFNPEFFFFISSFCLEVYPLPRKTSKYTERRGFRRCTDYSVTPYVWRVRLKMSVSYWIGFSFQIRCL